MIYKLIALDSFVKNLSHRTKKDTLLKKKVTKTLYLLRQNPSRPSLKIHKVETRNFGKKWSASVDEKIRILFDFSNKHHEVIELWDIGDHTVYKGKK